MKKVFWKVEYKPLRASAMFPISECKKSTTAIKRFSASIGVKPEDCNVSKVERVY